MIRKAFRENIHEILNKTSLIAILKCRANVSICTPLPIASSELGQGLAGNVQSKERRNANLDSTKINAKSQIDITEGKSIDANKNQTLPDVHR
jgi:hypothetical protein